MADPTMETFCCQRSHSLNDTSDLFNHFNSDSYNKVCLVSSSIGILGAIYQILPRESPTLNYRGYSSTAARGRRIIVWLAIADLLASVGVFIRSFLFNFGASDLELNVFSTSVLCALSSAWIQYFYTATWLWTFFYAIDMKLLLRDQDGHPLFYHLIVWAVPAVFTAVGLSILYFPDAKCHCYDSTSTVLLRILPNYIATYLPLAMVMFLNPILYFSLSHDVRISITRSLSQFTSKERQVVDIIKVKFLLINFAFCLCWLPNLINGILIWNVWFSIPGEIIVVLWYIMAITNPLQAVFNSLVYRRWTGEPERVYIPCRKENNSAFLVCSLNTSNEITERNETSPLLLPSINSI